MLESEKKYKTALYYVEHFGSIKPGMTVIWQSNEPRPGGGYELAVKVIVEEVDLIKGTFKVKEKPELRLNDIISFFKPN